MDIYIDVLIVLNTYLTWLLLSLTAALAHVRSKPFNRAVASFLGGFSALIILIPNDVKLFAFTSIFLKIISCAIIVTVAFWKQRFRKYLILCAVFFGAGMLFAAATELVQNLIGITPICLQSGFIYLDISPMNLIVSTALIYLIVCKSSKLFGKNLGGMNSYLVEFKIGCKAYSLDGIADTGNTARDLFSGLPVIICTGTEIDGGEKLRAVPYKTISGEGVLYSYFPDNLTITDEKGKKEEICALVASIDPTGEKKAIFNPKVLI